MPFLPPNQQHQGTEGLREYKKSKQNAKRVISLAKGNKQKECASDLNDPNHQNEIYRVFSTAASASPSLLNMSPQ